MNGAIAASTNQYLTFTLAQEIYALGVGNVREVLTVVPMTVVPRTSEYMRGVINVRGGIVPVIDLRQKLGMSRTENTADTCIIVIELTIRGREMIFGILADSVREVMELESAQIEPPPRLGLPITRDFLLGIGKKNGAFILILEVGGVLDTEELLEVRTAGEGASDG
jgi:purine-binding chemotaxis protein CheW